MAKEKQEKELETTIETDGSIDVAVEQKEEKPIIGKTTMDEAKDLADEGIPFIPLPWSDDKVN